MILVFLREILLWETASISLKCCLISNAIFWIASLLGLYADHLSEQNKSSLLARCKLQPHRHLSHDEKKDLLVLTSFNMLFVAVFVCCPLFEWMWNHVQQAGGPTNTNTNHHHRLTESDDWVWQEELLYKIPMHIIITEMAFYSFHSLLHSSSWFYRTIHKVHHRFSAPTAMACVYAHPLEFAIGNIGPIYLGPILTNAHPFTCYVVWFPLAMLGTCKGHCGYRIAGQVDHHDDHHLFFNGNYGGLYLSDYLFGTTTTAASTSSSPSTISTTSTTHTNIT